MVFDEVVHVDGKHELRHQKESCSSLPFLKYGIYVGCDFLALRNADDLFSSLLESTSKSGKTVVEGLFGVIPQLGKKSDAADAIRNIEKKFVCSIKCCGESKLDWRFADLGGELSLNVVNEEDQTTLGSLVYSIKNENAKFLQVNSQ
jgi:hypothetical protein